MAENTSRPQTPQGPETVRKVKKRPYPPVCNGIGTHQKKNNDYLCPICFEVISEAHMTKCGHTFCYRCITTSLEYSKRCPKCNCSIESVDEIYPNFLLNELITKQHQQVSDKRFKYALTESLSVSELQQYFASEKASLTVEEINHMLKILAQKKQQIEADSKETQIILLKEFLQKVRLHKLDEMRVLQQQLNLTETDLAAVEEMLQTHLSSYNELMQIHPSSNNDPPVNHNHVIIKPEPSTSMSTSHSNSSKQDGFNGSKYSNTHEDVPSLVVRRKRMLEHFNDLEQSYLNFRAKDLTFFAPGNAASRSGFDGFSDSLFKFSRFNVIRPLATLSYVNEHFNASNIVSSIEFDKDNEFFAIAGVTKKIKVFDYGNVIRDAVELHYPVAEMVCNSKISCVSWSFSHKNMLASSDYEGTVTLWDTLTSTKMKTYQEHEKRCWSVDFNKLDTNLIASGSDDSKVKIWSTNMDHSITSLEAKANVCCVKFNPESRFHLAFGSADHCVHYYDLRNTKQAYEIFKGHKKAVSYVKFLNYHELVSASTDSQLKLWNVNQSNCVRSFKGHLNEKNFVGLATDSDFIACGSESNSLYMYYKGLSSHVLTFRFDTLKSIIEKDRKDEDSTEFVSAVCWRMGSNVVVCANSQGIIKVLELV